MAHSRADKDVVSQWTRLVQAIRKRIGQRSRSTPMTILFARWVILRPFIAWCAAEGISPSEVSTDDAARFIHTKPTRFRLKASNFRRAQNLRRAWNFAVQRVPGWPAKVLPLDRPCHGRAGTMARTMGGHRVTYDLAGYHPSLVTEVQRYCEAGGFLSEAPAGRPEKVSHQEKMALRLARLSSLPNELLGYSPRRIRRLNAKTAHEHGRLIYRTATAMHEAGAAGIQDLRRITDVTTVKAAAILADAICARWRAGVRPSTYAAISVYTLCAIGRRCGVVYTMAETIAVRELAHELIRNAEMTYDLSAKNLNLLLPFEDPRLFAMLVALPGVVMKELDDDRKKGGILTVKKARRAEAAIGIEILNTLPLRISSLALLEIDRNFVPPRRAHADGKLIVFPDQEKNQKRLEAPLSARTWRLISQHIAYYRMVLPGSDRYRTLFPSLSISGYTGPGYLGENITRLVKQCLNVHVTVHLWRHIMGSRLQEISDRPEEGQRLLGHLPGSVSTRRYIRVRTNDAAQRLRAITDDVRAQGTRQLGQRVRRDQRLENLRRLSASNRLADRTRGAPS